MDNYEQLKADNKRLKKRNEWLQQTNSDLNKEVEATYERIHQLTIRIEELFQAQKKSPGKTASLMY